MSAKEVLVNVLADKKSCPPVFWWEKKTFPGKAGTQQTGGCWEIRNSGSSIINSFHCHSPAGERHVERHSSSKLWSEWKDISVCFCENWEAVLPRHLLEMLKKCRKR